jgi:predicted CXXCH cytochrome family protein
LRGLLAVIALVAVASVALPDLVLAQETPASAALPGADAKKPADAELSPAEALAKANKRCLNCHDDLADDAVSVHDALKKGCIQCHGALDASKKPHIVTGTIAKGLTMPINELCQSCHDKKLFSKAVQHKPVRKCTNCHLPHASKQKKLLKTATPDLCHSCHDKEDFQGDVQHKPVGKGACLDCHDPHTSELKGLLKTGSEPDLCLRCHEKEKFKNKVQHKPIRKCTTCHLPHVSKEKKLLKTKAPELCHSCHEKDEFEDKVKHKPVTRGACLECHEAHVSEHPGLLTSPPPELCLDCHEKITKQPHVVQSFSGNGHPIGTGQAVDNPAQPGKRFSCTSCHAPHNSAFPKLNRYDPKSPMGFCTKCHKI